MMKDLVFSDDAGRVITYGAWGWIYAWTFLSCHLLSFGGGIRDDETWMTCRLSEPGSKEYIETIVYGDVRQELVTLCQLLDIEVVPDGVQCSATPNTRGVSF
jgi:hypothetical protein